MTTSTVERRLRAQSIGLSGVVFQSITLMAPGAALALTLGIGIPLVGAPLPLAVVLALVACVLCAVSIGQLARVIPSAGGIYTYASRGLHPSMGFLTGWLYLGLVGSFPPFLILLNGWLIDETLKSEGWWHGSPGWWFWGLASAAVVFCLSYFDVRISARAGIILGLIEIGVFVLLSLTILGHGGESWVPFNPSDSASGTRGILQASVFVMAAFVGFEAAAALGEESRDPRRNIPRAIVFSCVAIGLFYFFCTYAWSVGAHPDIARFHAATGGNDWIAFGKKYWHGAWPLVFIALINSNIACAASAVNNESRIMYAMGRNGALPRSLGRTHPRHQTPHIAVLITSVLSMVVAALAAWKFGALNGWGVLALLFTIFAILIYVIACAACIGYFSSEGRSQRRAFLHVVIPALGILAFLGPLYAQYFSLDHLFSYALVYPFTWGGIAAVIWLGLGLVATAVVSRRHSLASDIPGLRPDAPAPGDLPPVVR